MFNGLHPLWALLLLLSACQQQKVLPKSPIAYFDGVDTLHGVMVANLDLVKAYSPSSILIKDSLLYVKLWQGQNALLCVNLLQGSARTVIMHGNGPGEALTLSPFTRSGEELIMVDPNKRRLITVSMSAHNPPAPRFEPMPDQDISCLQVIKGQECIIATGLWEEGRYLYWNTKENTKRFFGHYPLPEEYADISMRNKGIICANSQISIKPDLTQFVTTSFTDGVMEINSIQGDSIAQEVLLPFHYTDVGPKTNGHFGPSKRNRAGFCSLATTNEYIYAIYSGKNREQDDLDLFNCNYLMVFNWEGEPTACYKLNVSLCAITYNETENAIYGTHAGEETELYKFTL